MEATTALARPVSSHLVSSQNSAPQAVTVLHGLQKVVVCHRPSEDGASTCSVSIGMGDWTGAGDLLNLIIRILQGTLGVPHVEGPAIKVQSKCSISQIRVVFFRILQVFFCILQDFKVFLRVQLLASGPGCQAERRILGFRPSVQLPISRNNGTS